MEDKKIKSLLAKHKNGIITVKDSSLTKKDYLELVDEGYLKTKKTEKRDIHTFEVTSKGKKCLQIDEVTSTGSALTATGSEGTGQGYFVGPLIVRKPKKKKKVNEESLFSNSLVSKINQVATEYGIKNTLLESYLKKELGFLYDDNRKSTTDLSERTIKLLEDCSPKGKIYESILIKESGNQTHKTHIKKINKELTIKKESEGLQEKEDNTGSFPEINGKKGKMMVYKGASKGEPDDIYNEEKHLEDIIAVTNGGMLTTMINAENGEMDDEGLSDFMKTLKKKLITKKERNEKVGRFDRVSKPVKIVKESYVVKDKNIYKITKTLNENNGVIDIKKEKII